MKHESVADAVVTSNEKMMALIKEKDAMIVEQAALIEEYTEKLIDLEEEVDDLRQ